MDRAGAVERVVGEVFPSFSKKLAPSSTSGGFWLSLPRKFCTVYMPKFDMIFVLVDENGDEYRVNYIADRTGFSGGWRRFSIEHRLVTNDVLVFKMVRPGRFKVYIVRENELPAADGALALFTMVHSDDNSEEQTENNATEASHCEASPVPDLSNTNISSDVTEDRNYAGAVFSFTNVNSFEDFTVLVNGVSIDNQLLKRVRMEYYELCSCQNSFLHYNLREGTDSKSAAAIITEAVNIANAINDCNVATLEAKFHSWDASLQQFEELGLNIGFLRARLKQLAAIFF